MNVKLSLFARNCTVPTRTWPVFLYNKIRLHKYQHNLNMGIEQESMDPYIIFMTSLLPAILFGPMIKNNSSYKSNHRIRFFTNAWYIFLLHFDISFFLLTINFNAILKIHYFEFYIFSVPYFFFFINHFLFYFWSTFLYPFSNSAQVFSSRIVCKFKKRNLI